MKFSLITPKSLGQLEFVSLMAFLISLTALSIDSILPALAIIGNDFNLTQLKDTQLIIVVLFFGMAFGQFFYGPIADSVGRKPTIYLGISIFLCGSLFATFANDLNIMLIGRFLQGIGVSSARIVTMAIIRDSYSGNHMARIMSFMMSIFIIIPIIAPTLGFWILSISNWRMIYAFTAVFSLLILVWFAIRQRETLIPSNQHKFNVRIIYINTKAVFKHQAVIAYTVISGLIFGAFIGYLSASQHIFQNIYHTGNNFSYYFAALAASMGLSSLLNAKWVLIYGAKKIATQSLIAVIVLNSSALVYIVLTNDSLNIIEAMLYLATLFFFLGFLLGNLNALAMEPLGHLAGIGAGIIGSISTFISIPLGNVIGTSIDSNINNFIIGFLACSLLSLLIMSKVESSNKH